MSLPARQHLKCFLSCHRYIHQHRSASRDAQRCWRNGERRRVSTSSQVLGVSAARQMRHARQRMITGSSITSSENRCFISSERTAPTLEESTSDEIAAPSFDMPVIPIDLSYDPIHHADEKKPPLLKIDQPIANKSSNSDLRLGSEFVRRAKKMCDEELYPVGSIVSSHLVVLQIKSILDAMGSTSVTDDSKALVNAAIGLLERLSREPLTPSSSGAAEILTSLNPEYYNRIFDKWKVAALRGDEVRSATSMTQFVVDNAYPSSHPNNIESLELDETASSVPASKTWKFIRYDMATISMIMQVAAKQVPALLAPDVVQQIWNQLDLYKSRNKDSNVIYCYNALLKAWANSGAEQYAMKMEWIWNDMINVQKVKPNVQSYHILLNFYRRLSNLQAVERVIQSMVSTANNDIRPTISCWSELVHCHLAQALQPNTVQRHQSLSSINNAQTILQVEMVAKLDREDSTDMAEVATCIQAIMTTYRNVLLNYRFASYADLQKRPPPPKAVGKELTHQERENKNILETRTHNETRDRILASSEAFFRYIQGNRQALSGTSFQILQGTMLDIIANAGKLNAVQELFNQFQQPSAIHYGTLIKAYGNSDLANVGEKALFKMLNDDDCTPSIEPFNCLINAWAISSAQDAVDRAYNILRVLHENPRCVQFGLQPDTITYASILKCLLHSKSEKSAQRAEEILIQMERAFLEGNVHVKPNMSSYHTAIKTCFNVHDFDRAGAILHRMEQQPDIHLNSRIFNEIVHQCTMAGTAAAANQAEKVLARMTYLSQNGKPHLKPTERLYAKVLETWLKSNDVNASTRMWNICEYLMSNGYQFSGRSYFTLIPYFAKSSNPLDVEKADFLLQTMESQFKQYRDASRQPNHRYYVPLLTSYLNLKEIDKASKVLIRQAELCIEEKDLSKKELISPIAPSYMYITVAWAQLGQPEKAALIMEKMHELFVAKQISYGPCERTWKALIEGFQRSHHPKKTYYIQKFQNIMTDIKTKKIMQRSTGPKS